MPTTRGRCKHCGQAIYTVGGVLQPWKHVASRSWFCLDIVERLSYLAGNDGPPEGGFDHAEPEQEGGAVAEDSRS